MDRDISRFFIRNIPKKTAKINFFIRKKIALNNLGGKLKYILIIFNERVNLYFKHKKQKNTFFAILVSLKNVSIENDVKG